MISYDLHIHSALSPCADNDMTPNNIVNMAALKGLELIALTDHNTSRNCPAFAAAAAAAGIRALFGMELTTSEEIHAVCLFKALEASAAFSDYVCTRLTPAPNRPDIFGRQLIFDKDDNLLGEEERLLIFAADISIDELPALMKDFGGVWFPAHADKAANSLMSVFGYIPPELDTELIEITAAGIESGVLANRFPPSMTMLQNSDAHYLWDISEAVNLLPRELLAKKLRIDL